MPGGGLSRCVVVRFDVLSFCLVVVLSGLFVWLFLVVALCERHAGSQTIRRTDGLQALTMCGLRIGPGHTEKHAGSQTVRRTDGLQALTMCGLRIEPGHTEKHAGSQTVRRTDGLQALTM